MNDQPGCLLIVDDEEDFLKIVGDHFKDLGYEVLIAKNGREALAMFEADEEEKIDLVITDILMPELSGEELIKELRRRKAHLPILGITGHMDSQEIVRFVDQGAYYYLLKPLDPWPIVERLVENAVRFGRNEQKVQKNRMREIDIARLLRTYIITSSEQAKAPDAGLLAHQIRIDVAARAIDRNEPSGDFAEWFHRNPSEICFYIADASGHGDLLPSFLSCLSNMVLHRSHHGGQPSPDEVVSRIDAALASLRSQGGLDQSRHLTFFLGLLNLEHGELRYVNAGHPAAFLICRSGHNDGAACRRLTPTSKPVGFFFGAWPQIGRTTVRPGEVLFLYTDGANELLQGNDRAEEGFARLEAILKPLIPGTAQEIVDGVAEELSRQAGSAGFQDDTTLMAIKIYSVEG